MNILVIVDQFRLMFRMNDYDYYKNLALKMTVASQSGLGYLKKFVGHFFRKNPEISKINCLKSVE